MKLNKKILKLLYILVIFIICFNIIFPISVLAANDDEEEEGTTSSSSGDDLLQSITDGVKSWEEMGESASGADSVSDALTDVLSSIGGIAGIVQMIVATLVTIFFVYMIIAKFGNRNNSENFKKEAIILVILFAVAQYLIWMGPTLVANLIDEVQNWIQSVE